MTKILPKHTYENPAEFVRRIENQLPAINNNALHAKAVLLVVQRAFDTAFISQAEYSLLKNRVKIKAVKPDLYVPTNEEIWKTVAGLQGDGKLMFLALLYSGLRATELGYILKNYHSIRPQAMGGFVKLDLNWRRGKKNAFLAYLPIDIYGQLKDVRLAVNGLKTALKVRQGVPLKYARKVFYTQARSIGVPGDVVDFIQGRTARSVGAAHYLDAQRLADEWYTRILERLRMPEKNARNDMFIRNINEPRMWE